MGPTMLTTSPISWACCCGECRVAVGRAARPTGVIAAAPCRWPCSLQALCHRPAVVMLRLTGSSHRWPVHAWYRHGSFTFVCCTMDKYEFVEPASSSCFDSTIFCLPIPLSLSLSLSLSLPLSLSLSLVFSTFKCKLTKVHIATYRELRD